MSLYSSHVLIFTVVPYFKINLKFQKLPIINIIMIQIILKNWIIFSFFLRRQWISIWKKVYKVWTRISENNWEKNCKEWEKRKIRTGNTWFFSPIQDNHMTYMIHVNVPHAARRIPHATSHIIEAKRRLRSNAFFKNNQFSDFRNSHEKKIENKR